MIYYYFPGERQIWLMTLYGKNEASDLTLKEKQALKVQLKRSSDSGRPLSFEGERTARFSFGISEMAAALENCS